MKKSLLLIIVTMFCASFIFAQEETETIIPLIGETAPSFTAESTNGTIHFPKDFGKSWKIIFSHPLDFTPVCSTELLELGHMQDDFDKLDVKLIVMSTDNLQYHKDWKNSIESLSYKERDPVKISFPLIDDESRAISKKYGMIHPKTNSTEDVRGVFIIDPDNKIKAISFYPLEVGRNINEIKREVIALQATKNTTVLTPANWEPGDDLLIPYVKSETGDNTQVASANDPNLYQLTWYMTFKKSNLSANY